MIMTLYPARNLCRQIACFRPPPPSPTTGGERSIYINITPKVYGDRPVCSTTRQRRTVPYGAAWRNRLGCDAVKTAPLAKRRSRVSRDSSLLRSSPVSSLVADYLAVVVAAAPLIAHTSTVFPFRREWYLLVGFILVMLFYFILFCRGFCRFVVMLHSIVNSLILFWIW